MPCSLYLVYRFEQAFSFFLLPFLPFYTSTGFSTVQTREAVGFLHSTFHLSKFMYWCCSFCWLIMNFFIWWSKQQAPHCLAMCDHLKSHHLNVSYGWDIPEAFFILFLAFLSASAYILCTSQKARTYRRRSKCRITWAERNMKLSFAATF